MRRFINMILLEAMTRTDAEKIFRKHGLDPNSEMASLKKHYRATAMKLHPDRPGGDEEEMKLLNTAWDIIKDEPRRAGGSSAKPQPASRDWSERAPDFHHIDYVKHYFADRAKGKTGASDWTVTAFDGNFQRGTFTVRGTPEDFGEMGRVMAIWDRFYDVQAVFVNNRQMTNEILLVWLDGKPLPEPISFEHDSFNMNWSNDQHFVRRLPAELEKVRNGRDDPKAKDQIPLDL